MTSRPTLRRWSRAGPAKPRPNIRRCRRSGMSAPPTSTRSSARWPRHFAPRATTTSTRRRPTDRSGAEGKHAVRGTCRSRAGQMTSGQEWKQRIVDMVRIKQGIADLDRQGIWEYRLPAVAATEEELKAVEQDLGEELDPG